MSLTKQQIQAALDLWKQKLATAKKAKGPEPCTVEDGPGPEHRNHCICGGDGEFSRADWIKLCETEVKVRVEALKHA